MNWIENERHLKAQMVSSDFMQLNFCGMADNAIFVLNPTIQVHFFSKNKWDRSDGSDSDMFVAPNVRQKRWEILFDLNG